ncbi:NAD-P-binding protein [Cubamyces lactineus]|nr:NAD-P-binding protein [Cubamyces lactineus]
MASASRPTTWLVTGSSRGIGLELVKQLVDSSNNLVIAACRSPEKAAALHDLKSTAKGTLHFVQLDVSDFDSVRASVKQLKPILGELGLDYLINNAGIATMDTAFTLDPEELLRIVRTNVAGPALVAQVCLPFIEKSARKVILNVSSKGGSLASIEAVGAKLASYAMSKAALNMLTVKQKAERPDIITITLSPGWVKTDMGGEEGQLEPGESVSGILKVITSATLEDSGKFLRYNGEVNPW